MPKSGTTKSVKFVITKHIFIAHQKHGTHIAYLIGVRSNNFSERQRARKTKLSAMALSECPHLMCRSLRSASKTGHASQVCMATKQEGPPDKLAGLLSFRLPCLQA
jgi:hypothetical protein